MNTCAGRLSLSLHSQTGVTRRYSLYFIEKGTKLYTDPSDKELGNAGCFYLFNGSSDRLYVFSGSGYGNRVNYMPFL